MGHRHQPGADRTSGRVVPRALPQREKDLLYDVLCQLRVVEDAASQPETGSAVALVKCLDRGLVAVMDTRDQGGVLERRGSHPPTVHPGSSWQVANRITRGVGATAPRA